MSDIPYAAFDPIFWLHHANVDRIFAIWQAIYPDSYTTPQADSAGTFTNTPGGTEDINTRMCTVSVLEQVAYFYSTDSVSC